MSGGRLFAGAGRDVRRGAGGRWPGRHRPDLRRLLTARRGGPRRSRRGRRPPRQRDCRRPGGAGRRGSGRRGEGCGREGLRPSRLGSEGLRPSGHWSEGRGRAGRRCAGGGRHAPQRGSSPGRVGPRHRGARPGGAGARRGDGQPARGLREDRRLDHRVGELPQRRGLWLGVGRDVRGARPDDPDLPDGLAAAAGRPGPQLLQPRQRVRTRGGPPTTPSTAAAARPSAASSRRSVPRGRS